MRKLFTLLCMAPLMAYAQSYLPLNPTDIGTDNKVTSEVNVRTSVVPPNYKKGSALANYPRVELGTTLYDLQTNASIARRVLTHPGGRISVVWTTSTTGGPAYDGRGTGYNHFNGTSWMASSDERIENIRTGWPNLGVIDDNGTPVEFSIAHLAGDGGFAFSTNDGIGSTNWTTSTFHTPGGPIWGRTAVGGDFIHMIANYVFEENNEVVKNGVLSPTVYYRYQISTDTWVNFDVTLPGYNDNLIFRGGGDNYSIDARDSVVVIVIGGSANGVQLWKSTDYGQTFIHTTVQQLPIIGWDGQEEMERSPTNDGSVHVLLDLDNFAHVFWGHNEVFADLSGSFFVPLSNGINYWSERNPTQVPIVIAEAIDWNNDGLDVAVNTRHRINPDTGEPGARYGNTTLATMPQAGIDEQGNIYLVYSAIVEHALYFDEQTNYRDIYVVYSTNNGTSWSQPQNLTNHPFAENQYGHIQRDITDGYLHLVFQEDDIPGTDVQNEHGVTLNRIIYSRIPTSDILSNLIGQGAGVSVENNVKTNFTVSQNMPNPFSGKTSVNIGLEKATELSITVTDMLGKVIYSETSTRMPGIHTVEFDGANMNNGIYFFTVHAEGQKITRKMSVVK